MNSNYVLSKLILAAVACGLLILTGACGLEDEDTAKGEDSTSREKVLKNQESDFERMFDRYIACMNKAHSSKLEDDFLAFSESLTEYQLSPTVTNRNAYLLLRKNVEVQLMTVRGDSR